MKTITTLCLLVIGLLTTLSAQQIQLIPSATDSTRMDTLVISEMIDQPDTYTDEEDSTHSYTFSSTIGSDTFGGAKGMTAMVPIVAIVFTFGFPIVIVALVLWFKYKNRQAKYKLMSQALAAGQPLPKEFLNEVEATDATDFYNKNNKLKNKGIQSIFQGVGLGVFLWLLTDSIGLAAIGFMLFCIGVGQVIMAYTHIEKREKEDSTRKSVPEENQDSTAN